MQDDQSAMQPDSARQNPPPPAPQPTEPANDPPPQMTSPPTAPPPTQEDTPMTAAPQLDGLSDDPLTTNPPPNYANVYSSFLSSPSFVPPQYSRYPTPQEEPRSQNGVATTTTTFPAATEANMSYPTVAPSANMLSTAASPSATYPSPFPSLNYQTQRRSLTNQYHMQDGPPSTAMNGLPNDLPAQAQLPGSMTTQAIDPAAGVNGAAAPVNGYAGAGPGTYNGIPAHSPYAPSALQQQPRPPFQPPQQQPLAPRPTPIPAMQSATTPVQQPNRQSTPTAAAAPVSANVAQAAPIIPSINGEHGSPTRVYINTKVTPVLLEGMKILAVKEPEKPLEWLGEYLSSRSREMEAAEDGG